METLKYCLDSLGYKPNGELFEGFLPLSRRMLAASHIDELAAHVQLLLQPAGCAFK